MLNDEHLLQAMTAAGVDGRNVVYMSVPITSGRREVALMDELGLRSPARLREEHVERWRHDVLGPNEQDAVAWSSATRRAAWLPAQFIVVDPSRINVKGWDQDDYNRFWVRLMADHVRYLVASPGWAFSRGARTEVGYALTFPADELEVVDLEGVPCEPAAVLAAAGRARDALVEAGWSCAEADAYLPPLHVGRPELSPSAQSQTFDWLIRERRFQVRQFGSTQDDERLEAGGIDPGSPWSEHLERYLVAARAAPLSDDAARLELAKFTATAVGLMESAIRVHGPVPRPGGSGTPG